MSLQCMHDSLGFASILACSHSYNENAKYPKAEYGEFARSDPVYNNLGITFADSAVPEATFFSISPTHPGTS